MQGPFPKLVLLRSREGFNTEGLNAPKNEWLEERADVRASVEGWEKIVHTEVSVRDIPGNHFEPFDEANVSFPIYFFISFCRVVLKVLMICL